MEDYCCYCLDDLGVIRSIEVICADLDEQAKALAMAIFELKGDCVEIDLWGRARHVHVLRRPRPPSKSAPSVIEFPRIAAEKPR